MLARSIRSLMAFRPRRVPLCDLEGFSPMPSFRQTILLLASAALAAPLALAPAAAQPATQAAPQSEDARLTALFAADDEAQLKRNPIGGLFRGDLRYADQLGENISDAYYDGERKAAEANLV